MRYEEDLVTWANEQARFLRSGQFDQLDLAHLASEIESVGVGEKRDFANRMVTLLVMMIRWKYQPERRGNSWRNAIQAERKAITVRLDKVPSLKLMLSDTPWQEVMWADAGAQFSAETGLDSLPEHDPWSAEKILNQEWLPE